MRIKQTNKTTNNIHALIRIAKEKDFFFYLSAWLETFVLWNFSYCFSQIAGETVPNKNMKALL